MDGRRALMIFETLRHNVAGGFTFIPTTRGGGSPTPRFVDRPNIDGVVLGV